MKNLAICLAVAFLLRVAFVWIGFPTLQERWKLREDADGYGAIAATICAGQYTDVERGPIYPVFVAIAGNPLGVKLLQCCLDTATCLLVWRLAGRRLAAAWLYALYPFAIWRVAFLNKEIVLALLLTTYALVQARAMTRAHWALAGLVLGAVNLCKPSYLLWPVVLFAFAPRRAVLTLAAMCLVIAPWTVRNYVVTGGEFLPVATERGGVTTFIGNYQPTAGLWEGPGKPQWQAAVAELQQQHPNASTVQLDRIFYRAAWRQIAANPFNAIVLAVRKCGRFWFLSAARREQALSIVIQAGYLALLGLGLWRRWPWDRPTALLVTLIGYTMLLHALSYADLRFSLPVMPLVCALAAAAFQHTERSTAATAAAACGSA